jgi:hypothetical protein
MDAIERQARAVLVIQQPVTTRVVIVGVAWTGKGIGLLAVAALLVCGGVATAIGSIGPALTGAGHSLFDALTGGE